jgi:hypothetical protein
MAADGHLSILLTRRRAMLGVAFASFASAVHADESVQILFEQLYKSFGVRGYAFSDDLLALRGKQVVMRGYMAPPLKPESRFFVLTRQPLALCPFCQSDADWPADIVVVYLKNASPLVTGGERVVASGGLEVGSWVDPDTGFVSQVRIVDATFRRG